MSEPSGPIDKTSDSGPGRRPSRTPKGKVPSVDDIKKAPRRSDELSINKRIAKELEDTLDAKLLAIEELKLTNEKLKLTNEKEELENKKMQILHNKARQELDFPDKKRITTFTFWLAGAVILFAAVVALLQGFKKIELEPWVITPLCATIISPILLLLRSIIRHHFPDENASRNKINNKDKVE